MIAEMSHLRTRNCGMSWHTAALPAGGSAGRRGRRSSVRLPGGRKAPAPGTRRFCAKAPGLEKCGRHRGPPRADLACRPRRHRVARACWSLDGGSTPPAEPRSDDARRVRGPGAPGGSRGRPGRAAVWSPGFHENAEPFDITTDLQGIAPVGASLERDQSARNPAIPRDAQGPDDSPALAHLRALAVAADALLGVDPKRARELLSELIRLVDLAPAGDSSD
jgi:hypothetical protein